MCGALAIKGSISGVFISLRRNEHLGTPIVFLVHFGIAASNAPCQNARCCQFQRVFGC